MVANDTLEPAAKARLLGGFSLETADGRTLLPRAQKAVGILAYLVYQCGNPVSRNELVELFWTDRDRPQGLASLRQALIDIKTAIEPAGEFLVVSRKEVVVNTSKLDCDICARQDAMTYNNAAPLLKGLEPVAIGFDRWLEQERKAVVEGQIRSGVRAIAHRDDGSTEQLDAAVAVLALDPANDIAVRAAMRCQAAAGRLDAVATVYAEHVERLRQLGGFAPSAGTAALYASIVGEPAQSGEEVDLPRRVAPPVVALLPVQTVEDGGLSAEDGRVLRDELFLKLAAIPEVRVLARMRTVGLTADDPDLLEKLEKLGVDYVLSGSLHGTVARASGTFQLSSVRLAEDVWGDTVSVGSRDQPAVAELMFLATDVATRMLPHIEHFEFRNFLPRNEADWTAYHCYVQAKYLIVSARAPMDMATAERFLEMAIAKDPDFAPAYPHLISSLNTAKSRAQPGLDPGPGRERAFKMANQFLKLPGQNPNAHLAMTWCLIRRRQFDHAERSLQEAVRLKPYEALRLNMIGTAYVYLGMLGEGERYYELAKTRMSHDLDYMRTDYGELNYFKRDYRTAIGYLDIGEIRNPLRTLFLRSATLAQLGRLDEAQRDREQVLAYLKANWFGEVAYTPGRAVRWYLDFFALRRKIDLDNLLEGVTKAGFTP